MLSRIAIIAFAGMALAACSGGMTNPFSTASAPPQAPPPMANAPQAMPPDPQIGSDPLLNNPPAAERSVSPAVANAAIGGMFGPVGAGLDDEDKRRAYTAQIQALESSGSGAPVAWKNPDSGHYGSIVPGPMFDRGASKCRQYTHTIYIDGKPSTARGSACRNANGRWTLTG